MVASRRTAHSAVAVGLGVGLAVAGALGLAVAIGVGVGRAAVVQADRRSATARTRISGAPSVAISTSLPDGSRVGRALEIRERARWRGEARHMSGLGVHAAHST